ncbi:TspO/MBR family protein [Marinicella sediminis]|uniref:TspO/MBR family protein n=1 Tax=Marinicella sediminis TaxID=1792834 RepID=A0ABV7JCS8_9GAMM|nr:TspO/MBR family protein [Marinicella sediminis]
MKRYSVGQQSLGLAGWLLLCFAASFIGALASFQAPSMYAQLSQPQWAPPAWLFGPVWTMLYGMMAVAVWLVWRQGGLRHNQQAVVWFVIQLVLNALWSWLFFAWQQGLLSVINIGLLWVSILMTIRCFQSTSLPAVLLMVPYLLWVSFAAVLNITMWRLNPTILG